MKSMITATKRSQKPPWRTVGGEGTASGACEVCVGGGTYAAAGIPAAAGFAPESSATVGLGWPMEYPGTGWPHAAQKAAPSVTFAPHFEQNIVPPTSRPWAFAALAAHRSEPASNGSTAKSTHQRLI